MNTKLQRKYAWILTGGGLAGLIAMVWQASERITMLKNKGVGLSCDLNPIVDCGTVLNHRLSALFGFPNAFIGIAMFSMLFVCGLLLLTNNKPNKSFKKVILTLSTVLLGFSLWFFSVSLYVIGKICIFCLVGWVVAIPIFIYSTLYYLDSVKKDSPLIKIRNFLAKNHLSVLVVVYAIMGVMYLLRFKDYYFN